MDRSTAQTQVILLDGEQTIIGGLYTNDESVSRRGIPLLKDIPLIRYLFSVEQKTFFQRELIILLQAELVDPLRARSERPFEQDLMEKRRQQIREILRGLNQQAPADADKVFDTLDN